MILDTMVEAAMNEIKRNLIRFCETTDLSRLTPDVAEQVSGALQQTLAAAGQAGYRAFLLSHETDQDLVRDTQGEVYRFKKVSNRAFMTPFGKLSVPRRCYQNKTDTKSYVPLDAAWDMERHYMTPQVREAVLFSCAMITPNETVQLLSKCALFEPDATSIKREVVQTGEQIKAHRDALDQAVRSEESPPEGTKALVVSADGATVLMNERGVHFGRSAQRPGGETSKEKPTAYRVAMVGSVTYYGDPVAPGKRPERLQSHYQAHMPERGCPTFKTFLEAELDAVDSQALPDVPRILLLDGARELWNYFDKNSRYDAYHRCIDFWHAVEHLSVTAEALFGSGPQAKRWYEKYYAVLHDSDDGAARIGRSIDYYAVKLKRNKTRAKHLNEQRTYFKRNGKRMTYATFRQNGWPIGSGPIEAACKTLIKTRLGRSGMRWTRSGGQNILAIRTYVKSNRWDKAWRHIKRMERAA